MKLKSRGIFLPFGFLAFFSYIFINIPPFRIYLYYIITYFLIFVKRGWCSALTHFIKVKFRPFKPSKTVLYVHFSKFNF